MRQRIHRYIFFCTCLLLAFLMPVFPRALPYIIALMMLNWLVSGAYLETVPRLFNEKWRITTLSFASLYLLYMIGMLYSTDMKYGWFDLEVKLSLFIFPLIFSLSDLSVLTHRRVRMILDAFLAGCLAGSLILLCHTWMANVHRGIPDAFYYTNLSWYFHSSYLAMYYCLGASIALWRIVENFRREPVHRYILPALMALWLEAMVFLLSSKAGLILLLAVQGLMVLLFVKRAGLFRTLLAVMVLVVVFAGFSRMFPFAFTRISRADSMVSSSQTLLENPNDGTVARMEIWKVSVGLIRDHFLFGTGTGDVKKVCLEAYREHRMLPVVKKNLNSHNQYIQTFIALGVLGFILLAASLLVPGYLSLRRGDMVYLCFLVIFGISILFESMLETQAGVVFYSFFNVLFFSVAAMHGPEPGKAAVTPGNDPAHE